MNLRKIKRRAVEQCRRMACAPAWLRALRRNSWHTFTSAPMSVEWRYGSDGVPALFISYYSGPSTARMVFGQPADTTTSPK